MPRRPVLVGVDGSAPGDAALRWAAHEASLRGVGLRVIQAFAGPPLVVDVRRSLDWEQAHRVVEHAHLVAEKIAPELHVRSQVVTERPSVALIQHSADAGLVVLGKRGRGGFRDLVAGSVALQVAGHAYCPVALVHTGGRPPADDREIVVSTGADAPLQVAFAEADLRGVRLRAIRTWRPIIPPGPTGPTPVDMIIEELERNEENILTRTLDPWRERHPGVRVVESLVRGSTRRALIEAAPEAELVVVEAHEHLGAHKLALGTTAYAVIHHVTCPVLIAREHRHHRRAERQEARAAGDVAFSDER